MYADLLDMLLPMREVVQSLYLLLEVHTFD